MTKQKKKRSKAYTGPDASLAKPVITRMSAVNRNPVQQWWFEKKRFAKPVLIAAAVVIVVLWLAFELVRALAGSVA
jgi:hypothetical protein